MRGAKLSSVILLIAFGFACLLSAPAFSGEHPWDSDGNKGGGTDGSGPGTGGGDVALLKASIAPGGTDVVRSAYSPTSLLLRVSYFAAEKLYAKMYDAGAKNTKQVRSSGR